MEYISTKELAKKWKMDPSRIVRLANAGRIPGAKLIGNSWMFPADAPRLADGRRKENRISRPFRFPLYYYTVYTDAELEQFGEDERALYHAQSAFNRCEYEACLSLLLPLEETASDLTVKLGAAYTRCLCSIFLKDFRQAAASYQKLKRAFEGDFPHKNVLILILRDLETYFSGNRFYLEEFSLPADPAYLPQMRDFYLLLIAYSDIVRSFFSDKPSNPLPYEVFCLSEEQSLAPHSAVLLHLYTGILFVFSGQEDRAAEHIRASCHIACDNGIESAIAFAFQYIPETFRLALKDTDPAMKARILLRADQANDAFNSLQEFLKKDNILHLLDANDTKFVRFARNGMTNKEIGAALGLSVNTISKKFAILFEKTGTHSKRELVQLYTEAIKDY